MVCNDAKKKGGRGALQARDKGLRNTWKYTGKPDETFFFFFNLFADLEGESRRWGLHQLRPLHLLLVHRRSGDGDHRPSPSAATATTAAAAARVMNQVRVVDMMPLHGGLVL